MKWPKHIFLLAVLFVCACADAEELDTYLRNKGLVDISAQGFYHSCTTGLCNSR